MSPSLDRDPLGFGSGHFLSTPAGNGFGWLRKVQAEACEHDDLERCCGVCEREMNPARRVRCNMCPQLGTVAAHLNPFDCACRPKRKAPAC